LWRRGEGKGGGGTRTRLPVWRGATGRKRLWILAQKKGKICFDLIREREAGNFLRGGRGKRNLLITKPARIERNSRIDPVTVRRRGRGTVGRRGGGRERPQRAARFLGQGKKKGGLFHTFKTEKRSKSITRGATKENWELFSITCRFPPGADPRKEKRGSGRKSCYLKN